MEQNGLGEVLETEKELQMLLESEKRRAEEWIESVKKDLDEEFSRQESLIKEECVKGAQESRRDAEEKAAAIIRKAEALSERMNRMTDEVLLEILEKRIASILP